MTFGLSAEMDIVAASGTMRVTLRSNPRARLIHVAVAVIVAVIVGVFMLLGLEAQSARFASFPVFGFVLVTLWSSLPASETIEIDDQKLVIRREKLGWTRTSEYEIDKCTDFRANERQNWILLPTALWCKAGERTINFGQDMSSDQVAQVILELKRNLPHAADQLLMRTDITTLKLS
jgi:integral membrane protein DUF2244